MKANTASRTAQYMALFRALETVRPSRVRLFTDSCAVSFLDHGLKLAVRISTLPLIGGFIPKIIQSKGPGALSSGIARTKYIDDLLERTVRNGIEQVIILGAGFDTRALRLNFLKGIPVIEIDHPDTLRFKMNKLKERLENLPQHVRYIPIDFNQQSLNDLAGEYHLNFNILTTVIWEGVSNYLNQQAIDKTFEFITKFPQGSYIIFTYIDKLVLSNRQSFIGTEKLFKNLNKNEECWTFGFDPDELSDYLLRFNLTLLVDWGADKYRAKYMLDRKEILKGYEFYRVTFAAKQ
jgi:methyltransferase (TIGR00027 family)